MIVPTGLVQSIAPTLHRQGAFGDSSITDTLLEAFNQFGNITKRIDVMKARELSTEEQQMLARYAYYIRFRYRMMQPKKVDTNHLLTPRRSVDAKNDLWTTFNVIQENLTHGGPRIGKGITQFQDELRFNQELWTGADKATNHRDKDLQNVLKNLFPKKERNKNI